MSNKRKIAFSLALPILIGAVLLTSYFSSCERFEPELFLEITTDLVESLPEGEYKLTGSIVSFGQNPITQHGFCWSESSEPTVDGESTQLGTKDSLGTFSSIISELSLSTLYFVRAYATTLEGTSYGDEITFTSLDPENTVRDYEGNIYGTVKIGDQTWMQENLKVTNYTDGSKISHRAARDKQTGFLAQSLC